MFLLVSNLIFWFSIGERAVDRFTVTWIWTVMTESACRKDSIYCKRINVLLLIMQLCNHLSSSHLSSLLHLIISSLINHLSSSLINPKSSLIIFISSSHLSSIISHQSSLINHLIIFFHSLITSPISLFYCFILCISHHCIYLFYYLYILLSLHIHF